MTDQELIDELRYLGIDAESHRVVCLLPVVQVAWADGRIQRAERSLILQIASENGMTSGDGARILQGWLSDPPTADYLVRGRAALMALAARDRAVAADMSVVTLTSVVDFCERVARAAGGLFGMLWTVDARERSAIREIAAALQVAPDQPGAWHAASDDAAT